MEASEVTVGRSDTVGTCGALLRKCREILRKYGALKREC